MVFVKIGCRYVVFVANKIQIGSKLATPLYYYSMMMIMGQSKYARHAANHAIQADADVSSKGISVLC